jgi:hypothetical protein
VILKDRKMKKFIHSHRTGLAGLGLIAALGVSAVAMAQPAPPQSNAPAARTIADREATRDEQITRRAERRAAREEDRGARLEGHIAYMRTRLGITEAQAPLWDAFAGSLRNSMLQRAAMRPEPRDPNAGPPSLLERLERQQARHSARADQLAATASTLVPLYNALDDEQRETADRVLRRTGNGAFAIRDQRAGRGNRRGGPRGGIERGRRDSSVFDGSPQPL